MGIRVGKTITDDQAKIAEDFADFLVQIDTELRGDWLLLVAARLRERQQHATANYINRAAQAYNGS